MKPLCGEMYNHLFLHSIWNACASYCCCHIELREEGTEARNISVDPLLLFNMKYILKLNDSEALCSVFFHCSLLLSPCSPSSILFLLRDDNHELDNAGLLFADSGLL